ncbi:MAG: PEGA domain-containing protein [Phycisphaerae bacterium]|nr:PEGA domain-containing protein [Phycisphaerae bacterium]
MKAIVRNLAWSLSLVTIVLSSGCIERRLTINTVPAGALVSLNDEEIGVTPVTVNFNWYGDYRIQIIKEGYDIFNTHRELKAPLHDVMPFDLFFGVLWPGKIVDSYEWSFELQPYVEPNRDELIQDALRLQKMAAEPPAPLPDEKNVKSSTPSP